MGNSEVDQEELAVVCPCAPGTALCPSTTFAVHLTSSQSAPDRNKGGSETSRQF